MKLEYHGFEAIEFKELNPSEILCKHADPIEGCILDISLDEAREIAMKDPQLIYVIVEVSDI